MSFHPREGNILLKVENLTKPWSFSIVQQWWALQLNKGSTLRVPICLILISWRGMQQWIANKVLLSFSVKVPVWPIYAKSVEVIWYQALNIGHVLTVKCVYRDYSQLQLLAASPQVLSGGNDCDYEESFFFLSGTWMEDNSWCVSHLLQFTPWPGQP